MYWIQVIQCALDQSFTTHLNGIYTYFVKFMILYVILWMQNTENIVQMQNSWQIYFATQGPYLTIALPAPVVAFGNRSHRHMHHPSVTE